MEAELGSIVSSIGDRLGSDVSSTAAGWVVMCHLQWRAGYLCVVCGGGLGTYVSTCGGGLGTNLLSSAVTGRVLMFELRRRAG